MQEKTTKQTISPLARQSDTESSVLHPQQYLDNSCREINENPDRSVRSSSLETAEAEFEVVWRPKRGSLQLPTCSEGTFLEVELKSYEKYATKL